MVWMLRTCGCCTSPPLSVLDLQPGVVVVEELQPLVWTLVVSCSLLAFLFVVGSPGSFGTAEPRSHKMPQDNGKIPQTRMRQTSAAQHHAVL